MRGQTDQRSCFDLALSRGDPDLVAEYVEEGVGRDGDVVRKSDDNAQIL